MAFKSVFFIYIMQNFAALGSASFSYTEIFVTSTAKNSAIEEPLKLGKSYFRTRSAA